MNELRTALTTGALTIALATLPLACRAEWINKQGGEVKVEQHGFTWMVPGWRFKKFSNPRETDIRIAPNGKTFKLHLADYFPGFAENRVCFDEDGRLGYADLRGNIVIAPRFAEAHTFFKGFAVVKESVDSPYEIIDSSGLVRFTLPPKMTPSFARSDYVYWMGVDGHNLIQVDLVPDSNGATSGVRALYDLEHQKLVELPQLPDLHRYFEKMAVITVKTTDSKASPKEQLHYGFLDEDGHIAISPNFDWADDFHEGLAAVRKNGAYFYIDKSGREVLSLPPDCSGAAEFSEGLAAVTVGGDGGIIPGLGLRRGSRLGFIDTSGKFVIPPQFYPLGGVFREGVARVMVAASLNNFGYINHTGDWVIKPIYDRATDFKNGTAEVHVRDMNFGDKWYIRPGQRSWDRSEAFKIFLAKHNIFELDRKAIEKRLGRTDGPVRQSQASYRLAQGGCGGGASIVLNYENGRVVSFIFGGPKLYDVKHPFTAD